MSILFEGIDVSFDAMTRGNGNGLRDVVDVTSSYPSERRWDRLMRMLSGAAGILSNLIGTSTCSATSTSSVAIGTGSNRLFDVGTGKAFMPTQVLQIVKTSDPSNYSILASVVSYSGSTLTVSPISVVGSGTHTDWSIFPKQGDVNGISSSTANGLIKWLNTTGKSLAAVTGWVFDGSDNLSGAGKELSAVLTTTVRPKVQNVTASATLNIDWSLGSVVILTHGVNITTLTFSNIPSGAPELVIIRKKDNSATARTIAWPAAAVYPGNAPPALTQNANAVDRISLQTADSGTSILVAPAGMDFRNT